MRAESLAFLKQLIETPSPSGYEQPVQSIIRDYVKSYADEVVTDLHGNVIASLNPKGTPRLMFAGHCDQIGLMVQHIDDDGFLYMNPIGGWDVNVLIGQPVSVWTSGNKTKSVKEVPGVIARKPIHLMRDEDRRKAAELKDLWIDIGAKDRKDAQKLVRIGDCVTFQLQFRHIRNGLAAAPGMDDKVGAWSVMESLRLLAGKKMDAAVFAVSTVQEEIGLRGAHTSAFRIEPTVGIAVDVTHATDYPSMDKKVSGDVKLGMGPVVYRGPNINPVVFEQIVSVASKKKIPYQPAGASRPTGTDANAIQISRAGVAAGLISVPNRYMHSPVEMVSLEDLENTARLFAEFALSVKKSASFIP